MYLVILLAGLLLVLPEVTQAHCPLCTAGAGIAAVFAAYLGVGGGAIGIFIGAFAVALGLWVSKLLKKQYIPYQDKALAVLSFATTVLPLRPLIEDYSSIYLSLWGDYGSLLHRTYLIDMFFWGSVIGGIAVLLSPKISKGISALRKGKIFPYQGLSITFILLFLLSVILELVL